MANNPTSPAPVTVVMRWLLRVSTLLVLTMGLILYLLADQPDVQAWRVTPPITAAFLGAGYLASVPLAYLSSRQQWWAWARAATLTAYAFTVFTLIMTLLHLDSFTLEGRTDFGRSVTWGWLIVYVVQPVTLTLALVVQWRRRGVEPAAIQPMPRWFRGVLLAQAIIFGVVGLGMFLSPVTFAPYWPWRLYSSVARAIAAWLLALSVAGFLTVREQDFARVRPMMIGYGLYAVLQLVAMIRFPTRFDATSASTWVYAAILLSILGVGFYGGFAGIGRRHSAEPAVPPAVSAVQGH